MLDWIKLASFVEMKVVDTDVCADFMWLLCLGLALLELLIFSESPANIVSAATLFKYVRDRKFHKKGN